MKNTQSLAIVFVNDGADIISTKNKNHENVNYKWQRQDACRCPKQQKDRTKQIVDDFPVADAIPTFTWRSRCEVCSSAC